MIITTPMMQQNWDNAAQIGQIMDDNAVNNAVSPSSMLLNSSLIKPDGYSYQDYWAERSLAWDQMMTKPLMSFGSLASTSLASALTFAPVGELVGLPSLTRFGTALNETGAAVLSSAGRGVGRTVGWGIQGAGHVGNWVVNPAVKWAQTGLGIQGQGIINPFTRGLNALGRGYQSFTDWNEVRKLKNKTWETISAARKIATDIGKNSTEYAEATREAIKARQALDAARTARAANAARKVGSFASITTSVGGAMGNLLGMTLLNPVWMLKEAVLNRAIDYGTEMYENYSTRVELEREALAKGGRILRYGSADFSRGIEGGFTNSQRKELVSFIDRLANRDERIRRNDWFGMGSSSIFGGHTAYTESLKELKSLFSVATDMGMLDMSKSLDEVEKRFENLVKIVKRVSRITGKSKGELAMALASTQQTEGRFNINDAGASLERKIYAATATGANLQTVLMESQMGAQAGMQSGLGRTVGADVAVQSRLITQRMLSRGMLDQKDVWTLGGEQGVITKLTTGTLSMMSNPLVKQTLALMIDPETGKLNSNMLKKMENASSADLVQMHNARWYAAHGMSINPLTGMQEEGGLINGRMFMVDRALQRGDISAVQLAKVTKNLLDQQAVFRGGMSKGEQLNYLYQMYGGDAQTANLIWKMLQNPDLGKADAKEVMATAQKHLEDRYAKEYENANGMGLLRNIAKNVSALGFGSAGFAVAGLPGALIGLGAGYIWGELTGANKVTENWYLTHGHGAMTPVGAYLHGLNDHWWEGWMTWVDKQKIANSVIVNAPKYLVEQAISENNSKKDISDLSYRLRVPSKLNYDDKLTPGDIASAEKIYSETSNSWEVYKDLRYFIAGNQGGKEKDERYNTHLALAIAKGDINEGARVLNSFSEQEKQLRLNDAVRKAGTIVKLEDPSRAKDNIDKYLREVTNQIINQNEVVGAGGETFLVSNKEYLNGTGFRKAIQMFSGWFDFDHRKYTVGGQNSSWWLTAGINLEQSKELQNLFREFVSDEKNKGLIEKLRNGEKLTAEEAYQFKSFESRTMKRSGDIFTEWISGNERFNDEEIDDIFKRGILFEESYQKQLIGSSVKEAELFFRKTAPTSKALSDYLKNPSAGNAVMLKAAYDEALADNSANKAKAEDIKDELSEKSIQKDIASTMKELNNTMKQLVNMMGGTSYG